MLFEFASAIMTVVGGIAFALLSLFSPSPAGDFFFFASAVIFLAGPVLFLAYVLTKLLFEFLSRHTADAAVAPYASIPSSASGAVAQAAWVPEGLLRSPKGPLSPIRGRAER